jgi:hypothetical protein
MPQAHFAIALFLQRLRGDVDPSHLQKGSHQVLACQVLMHQRPPLPAPTALDRLHQSGFGTADHLLLLGLQLYIGKPIPSETGKYLVSHPKICLPEMLTFNHLWQAKRQGSEQSIPQDFLRFQIPIPSLSGHDCENVTPEIADFLTKTDLWRSMTLTAQNSAASHRKDWKMLSNIAWLPTIIGAVLAFLAGWLWYGPMMFYKGWSEGSHIQPSTDNKMPMVPMVAQVVALLLMAILLNFLVPGGWGMVLLAGLAAAAFVVSSGGFIGKNTYAMTVDGGYILVATLIIAIVHTIL